MQAHQMPGRGFTGALNKAGLAEGSNANTFKINATDPAGVHFAIDGLCYYKANADNLTFTSGHAEQADLTTCLYLIEIDADGNLSTKKGTEELTTNLTAGTRFLFWPEPSADKAQLGGIKVKNATGSGWTAGTDDLGEGSITDTYYDFAGGMPHEPLAS